ncbi:MAG: hypothetical protein ACTSV3_02475 [Candidatus Thorarchaeota archaeon]|nr:MAG: hypothetical protein DRP09_12290 [Candidatus Thorarchaeota archaeon]RLI60187.1 MAG: hypothetical protein DRO87_00660 [Candidatus Thorarchaeota archaeon]
MVKRVSLLGPDDFGLSKKEKKKKLAKDLSPAVQKEIERWLDNLDEQRAIERITELVGPDQARMLIDKRKREKKLG